MCLLRRGCRCAAISTYGLNGFARHWCCLLGEGHNLGGHGLGAVHRVPKLLRFDRQRQQCDDRQRTYHMSNSTRRNTHGTPSVHHSKCEEGKAADRRSPRWRRSIWPPRVSRSHHHHPEFHLPTDIPGRLDPVPPSTESPQIQSKPIGRLNLDLDERKLCSSLRATDRNGELCTERGKALAGAGPSAGGIVDQGLSKQV